MMYKFADVAIYCLLVLLALTYLIGFVICIYDIIKIERDQKRRDREFKSINKLEDKKK